MKKLCYVFYIIILYKTKVEFIKPVLPNGTQVRLLLLLQTSNGEFKANKNGIFLS